VAVSTIWELIQCFKAECQSKGCRTSEHEDWVKIGNEYHNFLWARTINPRTFKKIAEAHKCAIKEGISYRVVDVTYTAWILSEPMEDELIQTIAESPAIMETNAMYELTWEHSDKPFCLRLNKTDSGVFLEFENFLEKKLGVKLKPIPDAFLEFEGFSEMIFGMKSKRVHENLTKTI